MSKNTTPEQKAALDRIFPRPEFEPPEDVTLLEVAEDKDGAYWAVIGRERNWLYRPHSAQIEENNGELRLVLRTTWSDEDPPIMSGEVEIIPATRVTDVRKYYPTAGTLEDFFAIPLPCKPSRVCIV